MYCQAESLEMGDDKFCSSNGVFTVQQCECGVVDVVGLEEIKFLTLENMCRRKSAERARARGEHKRRTDDARGDESGGKNMQLQVHVQIDDQHAMLCY